MRNMKLVKAIMLGLCLSILSTGVAYAQMVGEGTSSYRGELTKEEEALFEKQGEIDQYVFKDYAKEIEKKGFMVNYTGVAENYVEIGISPYTDDNARYLYSIFGKDNVVVVAFDESIIYASGPSEPVVGEATEPGELKPVEDIGTATGIDEDITVSPEEKVYKEADMTKQIENTTDEVAVESGEVDMEEIYYTTMDTVADGAEVQLVSTVDELDVVKRGGEAADKLSVPLIVLAIAAGAAVIGGAVMVLNKKKAGK